MEWYRLFISLFNPIHFFKYLEQIKKNISGRIVVIKWFRNGRTSKNYAVLVDSRSPITIEMDLVGSRPQ